MKVSDIMTREVEIAAPTDPLRQVARTMAERDIGSMPVCDGRKIQGMITDRDIVIRAVAKGLDASASAALVMTTNIEYCFEDDDLSEVCSRMSDRQVRRLPVVDRDKNLVGIVALGDLALSNKDKVAGETLQQISQPH